jgi:hypothetical protein
MGELREFEKILAKAHQLTTSEFYLLAAALLNALPRSERHGIDLHQAIWRHSPEVAFEGVTIRPRRRNTGSQLEVYLTKRKANQNWPNHWHCPGKMWTSIYPGLQEVGDAVATLEYRFKEPIRWHQVSFFDTRLSTDVGMILHAVHLARINDVPTQAGGVWFPTDSLPAPIIPYHRQIVHEAVDAYVKLGW